MKEKWKLPIALIIYAVVFILFLFSLTKEGWHFLGLDKLETQNKTEIQK
jgi:hypothetical protein